MPAPRKAARPIASLPKLPAPRNSNGAAAKKQAAKKIAPLKRARRGPQGNGAALKTSVPKLKYDPLRPMTIALRDAEARSLPAPKKIPAPVAERIQEAERTIETLKASFHNSDLQARRVIKAELAPAHFADAVRTAQQIQRLYHRLTITYDKYKDKAKADAAYEEEMNWYGIKRNTLVMLTEMKARLSGYGIEV